MGGDWVTPGFAGMLAGLWIRVGRGAFEAEVVWAQSLQTEGYQATADLVRLSAVPCAARVLRRLHDHAGIALRRLGVAPRGTRAHRLVRCLAAPHPPPHQSTERLPAPPRHLPTGRRRARPCTPPRTLYQPPPPPPP